MRKTCKTCDFHSVKRVTVDSWVRNVWFCNLQAGEPIERETFYGSEEPVACCEHADCLPAKVGFHDA